MHYVWATLLTLLNLGFLALVLVGLPGVWLMVLTTGIVMWAQWGRTATGGVELFSVPLLLTVAGVALLSEIAEFFAGVWGSAKAGGSKQGAIGALVGGLIGGILATFLIPIPLVGSLIGACGGAFAGALFIELYIGRRVHESVASGVGAGVGRLVGTGIKLAAGVVVWVILAVAAFW